MFYSYSALSDCLAPSVTSASNPSDPVTLLCELKTKFFIWSAFDALLVKNS